jgi:hypothetical protein
MESNKHREIQGSTGNIFRGLMLVPAIKAISAHAGRSTIRLAEDNNAPDTFIGGAVGTDCRTFTKDARQRKLRV